MKILLSRLHLFVLLLQIHYLLWAFFRRYGGPPQAVSEFKRRLWKAGFQPVQVGPESWRWNHPSGDWSIRITKVSFRRLS